RLPGSSLAELLAEQEYRTAFLTSSDLGWANWRGFLQDRGYQTVLGDRDLGCGESLSPWGVEDRCLIDGMIRWLEESSSKRFLLTAWTMQTHHPYEPPPGLEPIDFFGAERPTDDYDFGRYLNVLHDTDRQLGRLFAALREHGLDRNTLVVVVGDHGESFGDPRGAYGHGTTIYEENVRVPMMLWSPRLFPRGGRSPIIGSHVELNQTIADLVDQPAAGSWQGRSLFDPQREPRAYFYVANDDYLLGIREDRWKYILDVTDAHEELYDLRTDRDEKRNVAKRHPEICRRMRQRLAARVEADHRFYAPLPSDG
ncbi:MAG: sulfatase family protein, partial [Candidatus Binatia bacterium]